MIAIVDYGAGNLGSVKKALDFIGAKSVITDDPAVIMAADRVLLPGVGSFGDAMHSMKEKNLVETVKSCALSGKPFLGICLGLQLLFESSEESPGVSGLGIFNGKIKRFSDDMGLKIPHIGWNSLSIKHTDGVFKDIPQDAYVYFVHSFYLEADNVEDVACVTDYGIEFHSAVSRGNISATQFHPEKSGDVGLQILKNFAFGEMM